MKNGVRPWGSGWQAAVFLGRDPATGRRRYVYKTFARKKDAERWRAEKLREIHETGAIYEPSAMPLGQYLQQWLETIRPNVRPATYRGYELCVRRYVAPELGMTPLSRLTPATVQRFYNGLRERVGGRTLVYVHQTLHRALGMAVNLDLIRSNPVERVEKPRHRPEERPALAPEQVARFLEAARGHRLAALWFLAASTGMRRGELCGLRWQDVDLERGTVTIRQQVVEVGGRVLVAEPKTAAAKRTIPLLPEVVEALAAHKNRQDVERAMAGGNWPAGDLVFASAEGRPLRPGHLVKRDFKRLLKDAGLPPIPFHSLRHTVATALAARGVHPKAAQALLGHAQVQVTLNVYSHLSTALAEQAVEHLRGFLPKEEGR